MGTEGNCEAVISVKVVPRSSRNQIFGEEKGIFRVKLTASPVDGKANKALKELLAKRLRLPKGNVEIISGEQSRVKLIKIQGRSLENVKGLLKKDIC